MLSYPFSFKLGKSFGGIRVPVSFTGFGWVMLAMLAMLVASLKMLAPVVITRNSTQHAARNSKYLLTRGGNFSASDAVIHRIMNTHVTLASVSFINLHVFFGKQNERNMNKNVNVTPNKKNLAEFLEKKNK